MVTNRPKPWAVIFEPAARKAMNKLDDATQDRILRYLEDHIRVCYDPRQSGHGLTGPLRGLWRYRVGDYRILCRIEDEVVKILVVHVGHRSSVYKNIHL